jgi:hypothetical protein
LLGVADFQEFGPADSADRESVLERRMIRFFKFNGLALAILLLLSCSSREQFDMAQAAISHFHELMAAKNFDQIYTEAFDELKSSTTSADFSKFLAAIDRKLGAFKTSENKSWSVKYGTGGTVVTIGIQSQYEKGSAVETFNFVIENKKPTLSYYNIQSQELLLN